MGGEEQASRRRWMARPRTLTSGFLLSIAAHAGLAALFVLVWNLLPLPAMRPIRIFLLRNAPTRAEVGLTPDGRIGPFVTPTPSGGVIQGDR